MTHLRLPRLLTIPALLTAAACGESDSIPVRTCDVTLTYAPRQSVADAVQVSGEWNNFASRPQLMTDRGDGVYTLRLEGLEPRDYGYRFVVGDKEQLDPENPYSRWVRAEEYSRLTVPDCRQPALELNRFTATPEGALEVDVSYLDGTDRAGPAGEGLVLTLDGTPRPEAYDAATGRFRLQVTGLEQGKHHVKVVARDSQGREAEPLYLPFWVEPERFRWESGLMYFAFTDRFHNAKPENDGPVADVDPIANYLGGDFAGITQKIEEGYFDALGVRTLWISPVDQNPEGRFIGTGGKYYTGYHGYWPSKPRQTQHRFGSLAELRALTSAAHKRGMRVIADLVLNHVHQEHPYWTTYGQEGWFNTAASCVCGTQDCDWEAQRLICKFTDYLPDFNWRSTDFVDQFAADTLWWLEQADFDGFRLDAVKHMEQVAGRTIRGKLKEITARTGTEFYLVGETFVGADGRSQIARYISPRELDGQFDFPLYWPLREAFADGQGLQRVDDAVRANEVFYAPGTLNSPFLGNHDVARFISQAAGQLQGDGSDPFGPNRPSTVVSDATAFEKMKYGFGFVLTQPGVPLVYYGDEVGLPGAGDPDNRRFMRFGDTLAPLERELLGFVQKLGQARIAHEALQTGARRTLRVENDLYVFQRDLPDGRGAVVAINRGAVERSLVVELMGGLAASTDTYADIFTGQTLQLAGTETVLVVPPRGVAVYVPQPE
ncbi:alpha-amylase family glycosyl hydrolase [Corallococcus macrosporus]|uniref:Glucosyl hydrolase family protein n=1 Tax=Myxococcus fulvus (strain ATCC BAA-855 / HW-1) TaxID=483219 RepID=F8CC64_MYXFH|nr:alpha-amylase family glycosyl hydrolase [Corallococcus macrosporus]AEI67221.1 glucosyl hydrolase family protein [Corallococcus macrosporus]